jgi:hypothetical protein
MMSNATPPRLAVWLLTRPLPRDVLDAALGDLDEEFRDQMVPRLGGLRARRWYWRQALSLTRAFGAARAHTSRTHHGEARHFSLSRNDSMRHDLRDALRTIVRSPGYSLITIAVHSPRLGSESLP